MKLTIEILFTDAINGDFKEGDTGTIDGYVRGADNAPYACVVIKDKIVLVPLIAIKVLG